MNNAERELQRRNQEKERIERNNYEIPYVRDLYCDLDLDNEDIIFEIAKIIIERKLTYREANRVLYHTDKVLYERTMNSEPAPLC
ncbi:hypothetical protein [Mediterraneibacter gnavus]|uniref:hypothetical protein n=1 Tax=Mediterraneibacter gnavus TaxID=33038 RepID=UPI000C7A3C8B|nr:hypothetical protein [Mediterraneibacter gnavus]PLT66644.1 hypothetical protein CDL19_04050 [Mediterraneibacter gnavus]PLT70345.1 hypothetical protein CDL25_03060 [Mediterraneibacter gnavus]